MSKKIKVIELIHGIVDAGAETLVKDYVLGLDKTKFDVAILVVDSQCSYATSANVRALVDAGIKIYSPYPIIYPTFFNKVYRKLKKLVVPKEKRRKMAEQYTEKVILTEKPDVIHMHMQVKRVIDVADKIKGTKLLYSCYSLPVRYFNENKLKGELESAKYLVANNSLRFIAMHREMQDELNHIFGVDNTYILRNAINIANFRNSSLTKIEARKLLGIPADSFVVGHVGRMFYIKNQLFLIDVFIETLKKKPNAFLLLVGNGEDKDKIIDKLERNNLQGKYLILSNIDNLNKIYRAMDVFVFPSLLEGIPNVCIEAQAAGLRCVISSSVTKDVCLSTNAIQVDLKQTPQQWADIVCNPSIQGVKGSDISEYEFSNVVAQLQNIYLEDV